MSIQSGLTAISNTPPRRFALPSLSSILFDGRSQSAPVSPSEEPYQHLFQRDSHGFIRLPPLMESGIKVQSTPDAGLRKSNTFTSFTAIQNGPKSLHPPLSSTTYTESPQVSGDIFRTPHRVAPQQMVNNFTVVSPCTTPGSKQTADIPSKNPTDSNYPLQQVPTTSKSSSTTRKLPDMSTPLAAAKAIITPSTSEKKRAFAFITHSQDTFGIKEPKIDNAPLARRKRRRTSTQELNILQNSFNKCPTPDKTQRIELAKQCNMTEKAVQIWFQNRRQAVRRQKLQLANKQAQSQAQVQATAGANSHSRSASTSSTSSTSSSSSSSPEIQTSNLPSTSHSPSALRLESECNSSKDLATPSKILGTRTTPSFSKSTPSPSRPGGQALTFHLKTDKRILTPIKCSPNKVNKLINGFNYSGSSDSDESPTGSGNSRNKSKVVSKASGKHQIPLRELDANVLK